MKGTWILLNGEEALVWRASRRAVVWRAMFLALPERGLRVHWFADPGGVPVVVQVYVEDLVGHREFQGVEGALCRARYWRSYRWRGEGGVIESGGDDRLTLLGDLLEREEVFSVHSSPRPDDLRRIYNSGSVSSEKGRFSGGRRYTESRSRGERS